MSPNAENSDAPQASDVEEGLAPNEEPLAAQKQKSVGTRLSTVSKKYDRNDKGYLDENEQKLREMDTSNRGFLTNDKVYALLEEQVKLQKTLVTQRKLLVGLCAFAVVLALANMGTAFAAANLSKDTTTDSANNLVNKQTNEIMATKAKGSVYDITSGTGEDGRRLGPTSMLKSEAVALWADYTDGTPTVKVRYSCDGSSDVVHTLPGNGKKMGFKYTYGGVVIQCSNNSNTCTVSGLPCSSSVAADDGSSTSTYDVDYVWKSCPPNDILYQGGDLLCDTSRYFNCQFTQPPIICYNPCSGTNEEILAPTQIINCSNDGTFNPIAVYDFRCPQYLCKDPDSSF